MSNFKNAMRRMRMYTAAVEKNHKKRGTEIEKLAEYKGSPFYDKKVNEINSQVEADRVALAKTAQKEMGAIISDMRKNVADRVAKAPTADMVNNLSILEKLNNVTPARIRVYAAQMADCPLAMEWLQQIAKANDVHIIIPNTEEMMRAVDVFEGNIAAYIAGFTGSVDNATFTIKNLYQFFQGDDVYVGTTAKNSDNVDTAFWEDIICIGSPAMLDAEGTAGSLKVEHFFSDMDKLLGYISKQTEGMDDTAKEDAINSILSECPGQYGAAYRYYLANGEKVALNQTVDK